MDGVDLSALQELDRRLAKAQEEFPLLRREYHERVSVMAKGQVDSGIGQSGVRDSHGNVRRWQVGHVGSGGGYAAVRPMGGKEGAQTGRNGPGAVTNYLDRGHAHRNPSGSDPGYRPRIRMVRTPAFGFYQTARSSSEPMVIREAEALLDQLAAIMRG